MAGDEIRFLGELVCHRSDSLENKIMSFLIVGIEVSGYFAFIIIATAGILYAMFAISMLAIKFHGWLIS